MPARARRTNPRSYAPERYKARNGALAGLNAGDAWLPAMTAHHGLGLPVPGHGLDLAEFKYQHNLAGNNPLYNRGYQAITQHIADLLSGPGTDSLIAVSAR